MSFLFSSNISSDPNNIYADLSIYNTSSQPKELIFTETRAENILTKAEEYEISVIRLSCDTKTVPLMIAYPLQNPNTDPNKLIWSISMSYKSYTVQQYITYIPQDISLSVSSVSPENIENPYYYIYHYSRFVKLINNTLSSCWNALKNASGSDWNSLWLSPNAFIELDPTSGLLSGTFDKAQYDNSLSNYISVYVNNPLGTLFAGFPFIIQGNNALNGCNYLFDIYNDNGTNLFTASDWTGLVIFAEYSTLSTWECVQSVMILSNTIPVVPSLMSPQKTIIENSINDYTPNRSDATQLFDIQFAGDNLGNAVKDSGGISYTATPPYRMMSLTPTGFFKTINLNFIWVSKLNIQHPIFLDSYCSATCKLYFKKISK